MGEPWQKRGSLRASVRSSFSAGEPPSDIFPSAKPSQTLFSCKNRIMFKRSPWVSESKSWRSKSWVLSRHCSVHPDSASEFLATQVNGFTKVLVLEREMRSAQIFSEVACKSRH